MNCRLTALNILLEIGNGAYSNLALNKQLRNIGDSRDRALVTEIVYGVLRFQNRLDYIIRLFASTAINKMEPAVLTALRIGIYQIFFLEKIHSAAIVNETVNAVKKLANKGAVNFVNAILRNVIRKKSKISFPDPVNEKKDYLVYYLSHPEWLVEYWQKIYGFEKTMALCEINNQPAELTIRVNTLKIREEDFLDIYKREGINIVPGLIPRVYIVKDKRAVTELPLYEKGGFFVQGQAAALTGYLLNPEPGMRVLDMAAAPGGKTTHLAELMGNQGEITALDIYEHKLELIKENCSRLGVEIVKALKCDAREYTDRKKFDMILLDAPCSGLGLFRQKPEIRWNRKYDDIRELALLQKEILQNALKLLKKGGILLYSTCTLTREENQEPVREILAGTGEQLKIVDLAEDLERLGLDRHFATDDSGFLELFPPESNTEGFFMAKMQKI
ncbi:MAG: 16S rRNA (cytosine(967)-C(5))-methyltransferase RsmB [Halanaerobiaceae bacterium]|jgi:16S rRNA (cytosine967-C5)-methyltransferase|nr:16S rRNA (cytosine(967)-C(5))-methyltransferase RsmB [Halanaerobiaceae bacterium]